MIDPISWEFSWPYLLGALAGGYILGSIPFGVVLTKIAGLGDVRNIGSGNIGATNVLRTGNKFLAALTLILDIAKGAAAVLIGSIYGPDIAIVGGLGAFIGHLFPVWIGFRGGKGVATACGIFIGLNWQTGLLALLIWVLILVTTRLSSLAALIASASAPALAYWFGTPQMAEFAILIAVIVWLRHLANIRRLLNGTESRIGAKSSGK